ncbi:MAG: GNAT family N-acetyltransferase [Desulfovibrionaceae bacterium]|jgi:GNAT superfamily N-acetyltransferase
MEIRKGYLKDLESIMGIVENAIVSMDSEGIDQWDDIYPNDETLVSDIEQSYLYVFDDQGEIKGFVVLNEHQEKEYVAIPWKYDTGRQLVIHRLCTDPRYKRRGIATALIDYAELWAKAHQYASIRLDAFTGNPAACALYERKGYEKRGIVTFRKGAFFCFEKKL